MNATEVPLHVTVLSEDGPALVFCHGLFGQGRNWTAIGKQFSDTYSVRLVDLPNHGQSPWTDDVDLEADADRLAATLQGLGPVTLVGHSMGGKVAMLMALRHPDLVDRLVAVDISPVAYGHMEEFGGYVDAMAALDLASITRRSEADAALESAVPDPVVRGFLLQSLKRDDDTGWRWQLNLAALGSHLGRIGGWEEEWSQQPPFEGPVMWVGGAESHYVKDEYAAAMEALFPRVRRVTVKNSGHWVHSEQPEVFAQVLKVFLDASAG